MASKKGDVYFTAMHNMACCAKDAAVELDRLFRSFHPDELEASVEPLHETERQADDLLHSTMEKLIHEFITPIEREDIATLLANLDDVVDAIEDAAIKANMYNLSSITPEGIEFCELIKNSASALASLMKEFIDFKKSKKVKDLVLEINQIEEQGDRLYTRAVKRLYTDEKDAIKVIAWTRMYDCLEKCCDSMEHVAYQVESAIIKNM